MAILGMRFDLWLVAALLAFSAGVTLLANWLVARRAWRLSIGEGLTSLVWVALVFIAGLCAARYAERWAAAYLVYGPVVLLLSLLRVWLYRRSASPPLNVDWPRLVRQLTYLVGALVVYLALCWLSGHPAEPILLLPLSLGALLPDLPRSLRGAKRRRTNNSPRNLHLPTGDCFAVFAMTARAWRTPAAVAGLALATSPLILLVGAPAWSLLSLGFLCRLALDLFQPPGVRLLWPFRQRCYQIKLPGNAAQQWLPLALAAVALVLALAVDFGPAPTLPAPAPSYEQTLARYYSLRGRNRVFAQIEGSWQASGRRWGGYFEVLNASGESFLILDSFGGRLFSAGHSAEDDFYLSSISLTAGETIRVKPVEIHLEDQLLAEALPVLYQMQREPGLLYIFISGNVQTDAPLPFSDAPDRLLKVQPGAPGQYTLRYLSAAELIALADLPLKTADLLVAATYASPAAGPTVTPLPSPEVAP